MPPRKKKTEDATPVRTHQHTDHQRPVIPDAGVTSGEMPKAKRQSYAYSPHLDPVLRSDPTGAADLVVGIVAKVEGGISLNEEEKRILRSVARAYEQPWVEWAGKLEANRTGSFKVDDVLLHIHERVSAQAIINAVRRDEDSQPDLFSRDKHDRDKQVQYYRHSMGWANRLILGDSLQVMSSLARREGLAGKVQMVYIDPPYGISYTSNWQNSVGSRDVTNNDAGLSREPEMIKAYRDTWKLGVSSYLEYLRQRLTVIRELLSETGSVFVQISDENIHRVRMVLDEIFGADNFISQISFKTSPGDTTALIPPCSDYILWYSKDRTRLKAKKLYLDKSDSGSELSSYDKYYDPVSGVISDSNISGSMTPFRWADPRRKGTSEAAMYSFDAFGASHKPAAGMTWKTSAEGLTRLLKAERLGIKGSQLNYMRLLSDYPVTELLNVWTDTMNSFLKRRYIVETNPLVIQRCMHMATEPGDLVLDPTCGSGVTAYVAEQWGRRWVTIDTSRIAVSIARQRLLTSVYEVFKSKDPSAGLGVSEFINPAYGFEVKQMPHITLRSIARSDGIDGISEKHDALLASKLESLNRALAELTKTDKLAVLGDISVDSETAMDEASIRAFVLPGLSEESITVLPKRIQKRASKAIIRAGKWDKWNVPFSSSPSWPKKLSDALGEYRTAYREKLAVISKELIRTAELEELSDQPVVLKGIMRVSGPFSVEGVRPEELSLGEDGHVFDPTVNEDDGTSDTNVSNYIDRMVSLLKMDGVTFLGNRPMKFEALERAQVDGLHALGAYSGTEPGELPIAVAFGPQYGPVNAIMTAQAIEAARSQPGVKELIIAGFSFDAAAQQKAREASAAGMQVNIAHIRPDVSPGMEGLLKDQRNSQLFTVFGQPEFKAKSVGAGEYQVELGGVCVYNPLTGMVESSNASKVAAWFLDADYDGQCFCVSQAFFPDSKAWEKIAKALGSKEDEAAFEAFAGTTSLPFKLGQHRRVAIKVIDPRGNEVMGIKTIA